MVLVSAGGYGKKPHVGKQERVQCKPHVEADQKCCENSKQLQKHACLDYHPPSPCKKNQLWQMFIGPDIDVALVPCFFIIYSFFFPINP